MKKNLYYKSVFRRRNVIKEAIFDFFLSAFSIPRLLLEVFIRTNFGERYFSFSTAIITAIFLAIIPLVSTFGINNIMAQLVGVAYNFNIFDFLLHYFTWYLFIALFVAKCIDRREEIKRLPSVFDFARYSLSTGQLNPNFRNYKSNGETLSVRTIETVLEPAVFFLIGLFLWVSQQNIGTIIMISSICYSLSYFGAYHRGDNFIMDRIDEMIYTEELTNVFVDGFTPDQARGVNYYGRKPADRETRRKLADNFVVEENIAIAL